MMQSFEKKANPNEGVGFILASGSPRRKELLGELVKDFTVLPSETEEIFTHPNGPLALVQENARLKGAAVASQYPERWVLGADTLVWIDDEILGKPKDIGEAKTMLRSLSGRTHSVSTGLSLSLLSQGYEETRVETSEVTFRAFDDSVIEVYFGEVDPLDKAGGYAIQTRPDLIIDDFTGSHSNVIGLPLELFGSWLTELGIA
jgi:septum formation protein